MAFFLQFYLAADFSLAGPQLIHSYPVRSDDDDDDGDTIDRQTVDRCNPLNRSRSLSLSHPL